jgi:hypothetical protein
MHEKFNHSQAVPRAVAMVAFREPGSFCSELSVWLTKLGTAAYLDRR